MSKQSDIERTEALNRLRELCKPGDTIYTSLRHVSRSGMFRLISCHIIVDNDPCWLDGSIARAGLFTLDKSRDALRIGGCGMDMGFNIVYNLSRACFPNGFDCIGEGTSARHGSWCPSNDHSNDCYHEEITKAMRYAPDRRHKDGGYALRHRWM